MLEQLDAGGEPLLTCSHVRDHHAASEYASSASTGTASESSAFCGASERRTVTASTKAAAPLSPPEVEMSFDAHILSLRTLFDPALAEGFRATLELRLGEHRFRAEVADERMELVRGEASRPDAIVETDAGTLTALAHRRVTLEQAVRAGGIAIEGDTGVVERFVGLFTLPEPFAAAA